MIPSKMLKPNFVFLDTETTGTDPKNNGVIEIGCVKVDNLENIINEEIFHRYIKPDFKIHFGAFNVHGISEKFLANKPRFIDIADSFLEFIADSVLIAHNAPFDIKFINEELNRINKPQISNKVIDSLHVAKKLYPGSQVGLDALIKRFKMSSRNLHSAIDDARILCKVYSYMCAQKEDALFDSTINNESSKEIYKMSTNLIKI